MMHDWMRPHWPVPDTIKALSTNRYGGFSQAPFDSFNLATHVNDDPQHVLNNRHYLKTQAQLLNEPIWLNQVSKAAVLKVDQPSQHTTYDASVTSQSKQACVVLTADCLPVLFCHQSGSHIAAAHAGWRGLSSGVLDNTLALMDCPTNEIMAWMGPAIGPNHFEVGDDVRDVFISQDLAYQNCFVALAEKGKWLADIFAMARYRLHQQGIHSIYGGGICTYAQTHYFSYRREGQTGRMATLIWRTDDT